MTLFGPVFHKELLELSRRKTTYCLRALAAAGLLLVVLIYANDRGRFGDLSTTRLQAAIGANIFANWMWYQFWIVCGAMPLLVGSLISAEREAGSLELLFTTHLTDREIVLGKLASRLFVVILLLFSALPVLVILGLLGGIDFDLLLKVNFLTLSSALMVATAGLYFSTVGKRPWIACLQTYGCFAFLWAFVPFAVVAFVEIFVINRGTGGGAGMPPRWCFFALFAAAPYAMVAMLNEPRSMAMVGWMFDWNGVLTFAGLWFVLSTLFVLLSVHGLRLGPRRSFLIRPISFSGSVIKRLWRKTLKGRRTSTARRWRIPFSIDLPSNSNPIRWRTRRAGAFDPDGNLWRLQLSAWIMAAAMIGLFAMMERRGPSGFFYFILGMEAAFLHVMIATVGSASIARERQRGSFDLLLLTNLTSREIVFGTLRGVFRCCIPAFLLAVATLAVVVYYDQATLTFAFEYGAMLGAYSIALLTTSVFISIASIRTSHAVAAAVVVGLLQWFLPSPLGAVYNLSSINVPSNFLEAIALSGLVLLVVVFLIVFGLGFFLLGRGRPFAAAVILAVCIPIVCLLFVPIVNRTVDVSLFWRWATDVDLSYSSSIRNWRNADPGHRFVPIVYLIASALITAVAIRKFDQMVERAPHRRHSAAREPQV